MILVVGNIKGGVGKTTLAVNLAIGRSLEKSDVLLVDGDEQKTALTFTELRTENLGSAGYTAVGLNGTALRIQVKELKPKYDDIIIDVGGRDTGSLRAALTIANAVLIPIQPRSFDIWSIDQIISLIDEVRHINNITAYVVLNLADAQGHDNQDAIKLLSEIQNLNLLVDSIGRRKSFSNAAAYGKSIFEYTPKDTKAIREINLLLDHIFLKNN